MKSKAARWRRRGGSGEKVISQGKRECGFYLRRRARKISAERGRRARGAKSVGKRARCCGGTIQLIFSTQGYGSYCFSVRPKARTRKFIEKGNEEISKRHLHFLPSFPNGGLYISLPPYRAPVGVEQKGPCGPQKKRTVRARCSCSLGGILGHGTYGWERFAATWLMTVRRKSMVQLF